MEKWQSGDMAAFESLFHQYEKAVFNNAYLITGSREDAEDVLQEVFTSVWKSRHTFDPNKGKLSTWLHRITVNESLRRRRKGPPTVTVDEIQLPETADRRDETLIEHIEHERMIKVLNTLDGRLRAVLVLRYFNDLSYEEIAKVVGVPLGTVKSRINHGLKALRKHFGPDNSDSPEQEKYGL
jgi:RNA polymerase sigma factor (sigma-70 family)